MIENQLDGNLPQLDQSLVAPEAIEISRHTNELVIAFVAAVGVDIKIAEDAAEKRLNDMGYRIVRIRVTNDVLPLLDKRALIDFGPNHFERISTMMDVGNDARKKYGNSIIAEGVASAIRLSRTLKGCQEDKIAYFVHSLKHPDEVHRLRELYPRGFYLIGVHAPPATRQKHLINDRNLSPSQSQILMDRDKQESQKHGQKLVDTFHLADFFAGWQTSQKKIKKEKYKNFLHNNISRFIDIIFGHPNKTPTFDEYVMYLAFSASLRSADLSRQVGAVITKGREVLGIGANDCPKPNGGLYWPILKRDKLTFADIERGRDWTRGLDSNRAALINMKEDLLEDCKRIFGSLIRSEILTKKLDEKDADQIEKLLRRSVSRALENSPINDLTEFGRVVHAEMEALLSCARKGVSTVGAWLFSTTFPCHNCAKHIVASGIDRVVFIEPYLKSRAMTLHDDSIELSYPNPLKSRPTTRPSKVQFEPFVGIGPRRFFDLFSMNLGVGTTMKRKDGPSKAKKWSPAEAKIRIEMAADSYLDRESIAAEEFLKKIRKQNVVNQVIDPAAKL